MFKQIFQASPGFLTRLIVGVTILAFLAIVDLRRNGRDAKRWREYCFLLLCVAAAITYGVLNDQITSRISWEYFYYGKDLEKILGPDLPPNSSALSVQAAKIGAMASWSVGLILGAALLIANNPRRDRPSLPYKKLAVMLPLILLITIAAAIAGGMLGWFGKLNWASDDFREMWQMNIFRPKHFIATWGIHLGGYVGGAIGAVIAAILVFRRAKILL